MFFFSSFCILEYFFGLDGRIVSVFRKEDGLLRTMSAEKLLKTVPTLQQQLDALLEFDVSCDCSTLAVEHQ